MKPSSPVDVGTSLVTCSIDAAGTPLGDAVGIVSVEVWAGLDTVPRARVVLRGAALPNEPFPANDLGTLVPGSSIAIRAGYDTTADTIFTGVIVSQGIEIIRDALPRIVVDAAGSAVTMSAERKTAVFTKTTDSALIARLISASGLSFDVAATATVHETVIQDDVTDWDFVVLRAAANGLAVTTDAQTVTAKAPEPGATPILRVTYGESTLTLEATTISRPPAPASTSGRVSFQGSALARPGAVIAIDGIGGPFDANVLVRSVHHDLHDGQWVTTVTYGNEGVPASSAAVAVATCPAVALRGLQRGRVREAHGDPTGEVRVLVELPLANGAARLWAPLSSFYASNSAGAVICPEVGDEVIVGFLDNDPRAPVVLGSVYGAAHPAPVSAGPDNATKAIVTRSKLELRFDDEHRAITISTPARQVVTLNDASGEVRITDANGNSVTLGKGGIAIDGASGVSLAAAGDLVLTAGGSLSLKAAGRVSCEGLQVDLNAGTTLSARGQATVDLTSAGVVTVRGALVSIN
jgi:phage protein D